MSSMEVKNIQAERKKNSRGLTICLSLQCGSSSRYSLEEKSTLVPTINCGWGGGVVTNDWCIKAKNKLNVSPYPTDPSKNGPIKWVQNWKMFFWSNSSDCGQNWKMLFWSNSSDCGDCFFFYIYFSSLNERKKYFTDRPSSFWSVWVRRTKTLY